MALVTFLAMNLLSSGDTGVIELCDPLSSRLGWACSSDGGTAPGEDP